METEIFCGFSPPPSRERINSYRARWNDYGEHMKKMMIFGEFRTSFPSLPRIIMYPPHPTNESVLLRNSASLYYTNTHKKIW